VLTKPPPANTLLSGKVQNESKLLSGLKNFVVENLTFALLPKFKAMECSISSQTINYTFFWIFS